MIDQSLVDAAFAGGGLMSGGILSIVKKTIENIFNNGNLERERSHERELEHIKNKKQYYQDVKSIRKNIHENDKKGNFGLFLGSFFGWTRRILALAIPLMFVMLYVCARQHIPIFLPVEVTHHFLGVQWQSYKVLKMNGIVIPPGFQELAFMVYGLYFGRL